MSQPRDQGGQTIPVLGIRPHGSHRVDFASTTSETSNVFDSRTQVVTIYSTQDCYIETGDVTVNVENAAFIASSVPYDIAVKDRVDTSRTCLSVRGANSAGTMYINERL